MKQLALMTRYEVPISYRFSRDVQTILLVVRAQINKRLKETLRSRVSSVTI